MALNWLLTGKYLIVHCGENAPCIIENTNPNFKKMYKLLKDGASEKEVSNFIDIFQGIKEYSNNTISLDKNTGVVTIDGEVVNNIITKKIMEFYKKDLPYTPLVNFWRNIQKNPSEESKSHLYQFLEANKMPITDDGCFLAYKRVVRDEQGNLVDTRTKTFCNNIGAVVTMDRKDVDPNRNNTCSKGLHVAAYHYAADVYSGTDLLEVKVNPSDVVAVPTDYNNQKMRVCRYEVIGINNKGPIEKDLLPKEEVRAKRKLSKKVDKQRKNTIKEKNKQEELERITNEKEKLPGSSVTLNGFTAPQIIEIVESLTGQVINISLKDKKRILKKAKEILIEHKYYVF